MNGFAAVVKAEFLKGKRAAPRKVAPAVPLVFALLGLAAAGAFGGGAIGGFATVGWNYWYALPLPIVVTLVATSVANIDAKQKLRGVLGLPIAIAQVWWAKILYALALVFAANAVVLAASVAAGFFDPDTPDLLQGLITAVLLTLGHAWLIPAALFLAVRVNTMAAIAVPSLIQLVLGIFFWSSSIWWLVPCSAVLRAVSPFVGVMPSGVPLAPGDPMGVFGWQAAAGMGIAVALFAVLAVLGARWFAKREAA